MLPTKSDLKVARIQIILTALSVATTTILYTVIIFGNRYIDIDLLVRFYGALSDTPLQSSISSLDLVYISLVSPDIFPTWYTVASAIRVIGYVLNIGVLLNSTVGSRVKQYKQISGTGYSVGIIGSLIGVTVILNTFTFWFAGYIMMILSLGFTIRTYRQIKASLVTRKES